MKNVRLSKRIVLAFAVVAAAPLGIAASQCAFATGDAGAPLIDKDLESCMHKVISKRFYRRIDATEEQKEKLDAIWTSTADSTRPQREELRRNVLALSDLMASDSSTDDQITAKVSEIRQLHQKVQDERLASVLKARKILTAQQRQKIHDRLNDFITGGGGGLRSRKLSMLLDE